MTDFLTLEDLAAHTGESVDVLREWQEKGLIGRDPEGYTRIDAEFVRLCRLCVRRGLTVEDVTGVQGVFSLRWYDDRRRGMIAGPAGELRQVAERIGMDEAQARRLWVAAGLMDQGESADRADAAMLRGSKTALDAGYPEEALREIFRVLAETIGRFAEAAQHTTHRYQLEVPIIQGEQVEDVKERAHSMSPEIVPLIEPMVLYFLRKAMLRALREDFAVHVAIESGKATYGEVPGRIRRTIGFIDMSDFTPLTATKSDVDAATVLRQFSDMVRGSVMNAGGSVVKQIGDEFMLSFYDAASAVNCLAGIHRSIEQEPQFPAVRTGLHAGEMLYRDGDYVGTVPNTAARIRGMAGSHQIMVSGEVRREAGKVEGVEFVRVGRRALKGLPEDMEVFEVVAGGGEDGDRAVDPVCGIEMASIAVAARLTLDGAEREFCSDDCLRKFVVEPAKYGAKGGE